MQIIDFHTHIFPGEVLKSRESFFDDPGFKLLYSSSKSLTTGHTGLADYILKNDLDAAVAMSFPWAGEKHCLHQNEYMASISGHGSIFPFGMIPFSGSKSVRRYAEDIKNSGLYGIGEVAFYKNGMNKSAIKFLREVLEASAEFSLPLCLHLNEPVGHQYPGKYEPALAAVYEIIVSVPGAMVILSHWGGGLLFYELMPEACETLKNVYYDTAASPYLYRDGIYGASVKITGADKILFGSDYPLLGVGRYKIIIEQEVHTESDRKKIMGLNAKRILNI